MSEYLATLADTLRALAPAELAALRSFVAGCTGTLYVAGNGGSHAAALHWACDLQKATGRRVVTLGANGAVLSAWANDDGYDGAWASELATLAGAGDRVVALSCSGTSPNVRALLSQARAMRLPCALVTGAAGPSALLRVPSRDYGVIEDCFAALGHYLTAELRHDNA